MQDNLQKAAALNARRNVLRAEEDQHRHAEEKRIALAAQEMVEKREREYECGALTARFPIEFDESRHNPIEGRIGCT